MLTMALSEIPTGAVADAFGRRTSMIIGTTLLALTYFLYARAPTFPFLMCVNLLWAISASFVSGAEQAFLYDSLSVLGRADDYPKIAGRVSMFAQGCMIAGGVLGGIVGSIDLALPFVLTGVLGLMRSAVVLSLREPPRMGDRSTSRRRRYKDTLRQAWRAMRARTGLRYALAYASTIPLGMFAGVAVFLQPYARSVGVPVAAMGLVLTGITGAGMLGSAAAADVRQRLGERLILVAGPVVIMTGFVMVATTRSPVGILFLGMVAFVSAALNPMLENIILRESPADTRATIMSAESFLFSIILAGIMPVLGLIGDRFGLAVAFITLGSAICTVLVPLASLWTRRGPTMTQLPVEGRAEA